MRVGFVSLGCAKNLVSSEQMLKLLDDADYEITAELENVDVVIVNTCGFIESAKSEAIENILELAALKNEGKIKKILAAGCLAQRYGAELLSELPELDGIVGCGSFGDIVSAVDRVIENETPILLSDIDAPLEEIGRILTTPDYTSYLRIAEGCDNRCAFCVIPSIRGKYRSRAFEDILGEAEALAEGGVKELIVIAQDTTRYGLELYGKRRLPELLTALCAIDGLEWVRLHYMYPDEITDELIDVIVKEDKIVKYLDIPLQHINDKLLKSMNRRSSRIETEALITRLRASIPGLVIRTSLICGLPGEGEAEFEELCDFLRRFRLERAGVFAFSPEEGTPAADMENRVDEDTAARRVELVRALQSEIMDEYNEKLIGNALTVLCEGYDRLAGCWYGRSYADSPEVDGKVFFTAKGLRPAVGEMLTIRVTETLDGDLVGEMGGIV